MEVAINYSPEAAALLEAGRIGPDRFKCPDWEHLIPEARAMLPSYVHWPLRAGQGIGDDELRRVERMLAETDTPLINAHLAPRAPDYAGLTTASDGPEVRERLVESMLADVRRLAEAFGPERVVLENLPWAHEPPTELPRAAVAPEVVAAVVRQSRCRLLLDIGHAWLAAGATGWDWREYLLALPGDRLGDVHVSGTARDETGRWGDHQAMRDEDWTLVEWVLERIDEGRWARPGMVTMEYGGVDLPMRLHSKAEVIARDFPQLTRLARRGPRDAGSSAG